MRKDAMLNLYNFLKASKEDFDSFTIDDLPSEPMQNVYRVWKNACNGVAAIPEYRDIVYQDIGKASGYTALIKFIDDDKNFDPSYITLGESLKKLAGHDYSGKKIRHAYKKNISREPLAAYSRVYSNEKPLFTRKMALSPLKIRGYDRLILPIKDSKRLKFALLFIQPTDPSIKNYSDWREASDIVHWLDYLENN